MLKGDQRMSHLAKVMATNFNPLNTAHLEPAPIPLLCASKIVLYANLGLSQITFSLCPLVKAVSGKPFLIRIFLTKNPKQMKCSPV